MNEMNIIACLLIAAGIIIRLSLGNYLFQRRYLGFLLVRNYWMKLVCLAIILIVKTMAWASILTGAFLLVVHWYNQH